MLLRLPRLQLRRLLAPALGITPADLTARAHYEALTVSLSGRALQPDPDPPKPGTLI